MPNAEQDFVGSLRSAGFELWRAQGRAAVLSRADVLLEQITASRDEAAAFLVPGRIEFLGKHTDYCGGRSLLCAVDRGFGIVAIPRKDRVVRIADPFGGPPIVFDLDPELMVPSGTWINYPMTVARRMARNFPNARFGADIAFASDLPPSAGMSSSSALMIAIYLALAAVNRLTDDSIYRENISTLEDLAGYLGTVENGQTFRGLKGDRGVGTFGGSQDHTAILCSAPGILRQYSFCPVRHERDIPLPTDYVLAVGTSGVIAEKSAGARDAYNAVSASVATILVHWRQKSGRNDATLADAVRSYPAAIGELRNMRATYDNARLMDRFEQFLAESEQIIPAAATALANGQIEQLGVLIDRSQYLSETLLKNQVPETVYLAKAARDCGAAAASAFGAGFGGSVWAMVSRTSARSFLQTWQDRYVKQFPEPARRAIFFITSAGNAASEVAYFKHGTTANPR